jgi:hypothetical protein
VPAPAAGVDAGISLAAPTRGSRSMSDIGLLSLGIGFFIVALFYTSACDRL